MPDPLQRPVSRYYARAFFFGACLLLSSCRNPGHAQGVEITDSGGPLMYEQAAYDVTFYDLALQVFPETRTIDGALTVNARIVQPINEFVLDLDTTFSVSNIESLHVGAEGTRRAFSRDGGKLWVDLGRTYQPGEAVSVRVHYAGAPRVADNPPWGGGFTWASTEAGRPWIATSMQGEGADLWWPCKDHPSDEADSVSLHFTVPEGLVAVSNGRSRGSTQEPDGRKTYHWFVSTPINNYAVALNVAPYEEVATTFQSIDGQVVPVGFWVLPERKNDAEALLPELLEHVAFYESVLGPYPFRADKYGVVHAPFLGMEHQTLIAYGSNFNDVEHGYDWLHHHELGHEWWGNMVTAADWRDFWIHEGLCTYMQALYAGRRFGQAAYDKEIAHDWSLIKNRLPVAPRESTTSDALYFFAGGKGEPNNDIYYKGAVMLHTLRYLIGDEAFFRTLRRFAYPTEAMEHVTDGSQCRFVATEDFVREAERNAGRPLDWFFDVYLRQASLPALQTQTGASGLSFTWKVPGGRPFPMPVDVVYGGVRHRLDMKDGTGTLPLADGPLEIDPGHSVLRVL